MAGLQHLLYREDKGTEAEHWFLLVDLAETVEDEGYAVILAHGDDGGVHAWPCVAAVVWLTGLAATAHSLLEAGEAALHRAAECLKDAVVMSLVVCDEYSFHCLERV